MTKRFCALILCGVLTAVVSAAEPKPLFDSKLVSKETPGHAVNVDVDVTGAKELYLVVRDGGDGFTADWADWAEPRLVGPKGEIKLTELKWKSAAAGWGEVRIDKNADGGRLRISGKEVPYGIGTHANSVISFALPDGVTRFKARAGIDNGGSDQGNGSTLQFLVFTEKPPASVLAAAPSNPGAQSRDPVEAVAGLDVAEGLEATLFAAEPTLLSPTDIDVDHLGRVWVCEVVNYRHRKGERPEGDRILILEDTDQDGVCDKTTVFYQGTDIDTALGICVLGNKVIVSVAPNIFIFTDEDGDGKADKKELLFTKTGDPQHDHSAHAFTFGPDGRLYFNVGNTGHRVCDKDGNPIIDMAGNEVNDSGKPYRQGLVFRCNLDGSEFETLGWNFRNNYEVAVDSFGTLWQSDNDDDGNKGVRINYVMEFGNYGYVDELTGAGWQTPRTNMETEIPLKHWHLNDPGVVPNLVQTGAGSPTGICVYEGDLLPKIFQGQVIHCDAGPNVVRAYPAKVDGAGYSAEMVNVLFGARDQWFRPSDVCVAPDGSLIVADWYDPGVGGHRMGDADKGRIFRVAPPGKKYEIPKYDFKTADGAVQALQSPNLEARFLAWSALAEMPGQAEPALLKLYKASKNPRHRARALWLLSTFETGPATCKMALKDADPNIRITALRALRALRGGVDIEAAIGQLVKDPSPQVRRECAIAIRELNSPKCPDFWATIATQYDGKDRWYLEALGIGAALQWDTYLAAWRKMDPGMLRTKAGRDIVWRSRAAETPTMLMEFIEDPTVPMEELPRYFRALDFLTGKAKEEAVAELAFAPGKSDDPRAALILLEAVNRLQGFDVNSQPEKKAALERVLKSSAGTPVYLALVDRFNLTDHFPQVLKQAQEKSGEQLGVDSMRLLLNKDQKDLIAAALSEKDELIAAATARSLANTADGRAQGWLLGLILEGDRPDSVRQEAVRGLSKTKPGALELLKLFDEKKLPDNLNQIAAAALHSAPFDDIKQEAIKRFPLPPSRNDKPLPPLAELLKSKGAVDAGQKVFATVGKCATCHVVGKDGKEIGPNLSEIGSKLSREALFESILFPSAGISHNFETWAVATVDGNVITGILTTHTPDSVSIKNAEGLVREIKKSDIDEMKKQSISLMPADLQKTMTAEELIDVIEYLQTLKKK